MLKRIKAIDFFCGAGGMTKGLQLAGIDVFAGVDYDKTCKDTYQRNTNALFINKSIIDIKAKEIKQLFKEHILKNEYTMITGCAPCQPYSSINTRKKIGDHRKTLLDEFARIIKGVKPHFVLMENVSGLTEKNEYFSKFINMLLTNNYKYEYKILNAKDYGVAQNRKRLFLIATRLKNNKLSFLKIKKTKEITLKDVIYNLEPITHETPSVIDYLHRSLRLNDINLKRIQATRHNGGTRAGWHNSLKAKSHIKKNIFKDNYGRLSWNKPSSTITTKFNQYYSGRFGHPEQDRALSLREGALIQSFPKDYMFFGTDYQIARQIGNAVPVNLSKAVGEIFINSLD